MTNVLRPDEMARESEIKKAQGRTNAVRSGLKTVASLGGAGIAAKILPFLSQYVPSDLALKGINKVAPVVGNFLKSGMSKGLTLQSGLSFLSENLSNEKEKESIKEDRNIIEQYSPELHQFMTESIGSGEDPIRAAASAIFDKKKNFESIIKKMEKDHNTPWSSIVESVYGQQGVKKTPNQPEQGQQQPNQSGQGLDPGVAQILQQGNAIMQKFRGQ